MKGLLLKDWYLTIRYGKMQLIFAVVYGVIGAILPKANAFVALPVMLVGLLPNTIYAYDEREKWICGRTWLIQSSSAYTEIRRIWTASSD